ncbi:choice-of-anchor C family protein [Streptomyces sp. NPDC051041]|uniref:choice-of-anchor C family protein n=1 Tax=Streptomyces sp. NPDC051041 TaxID=3365640 RepID=UPI0037990199
MLLARACITAIAATSLFTATGTAAAAPTVGGFDNGSFESPVLSARTFTVLRAGQSIGPWQITSGAADLIGTGFWQAAEGGQSVDLNAGDAATVAQTFTTVPGEAYTVTYALAGNPAATPRVKTGKVLVDGHSVQDFSFDTAGKSFGAMGYVNQRFAFIARADTTTLAFASTIPSTAGGPVIDDVRVHPCSCGT